MLNIRLIKYPLKHFSIGTLDYTVMSYKNHAVGLEYASKKKANFFFQIQFQ